MHVMWEIHKDGSSLLNPTNYHNYQQCIFKKTITMVNTFSTICYGFLMFFLQKIYSIHNIIIKINIDVCVLLWLNYATTVTTHYSIEDLNDIINSIHINEHIWIILAKTSLVPASIFVNLKIFLECSRYRTQNWSEIRSTYATFLWTITGGVN